jgi:alkanesulfonate monooxygenase SsuD/methylene tetrahydromethanopterin reductase-like flavin-dependent oxidoreductase (luciferase family)
VKLGLTLPSFREDTDPALEVARAAEAAEVDGVFVFDHLFRRARDGSRRPALDALTLLAAVAAETSTIAVGVLVIRATLRPPATLAAALDTLHRIAPGRLLPTIGAGDTESREEMETFGLGFDSVADRVAALATTVELVRDRGYPIWVGGTSTIVRETAAACSDGWNRWGGSPETFAAAASVVRPAAVRTPFTLSWGGLVALGADDAEADEKAGRLGASDDVLIGGPARVADGLRAYREAGADWAILGPLDSSNPNNAAILGGEIAPRVNRGQSSVA